MVTKLQDNTYIRDRGDTDEQVRLCVNNDKSIDTIICRLEELRESMSSLSVSGLKTLQKNLDTIETKATYGLLELEP